MIHYAQRYSFLFLNIIHDVNGKMSTGVHMTGKQY